MGVEQKPINNVFGAEQKIFDPVLEQWVVDNTNFESNQVDVNVEFVLSEQEALQMIFDRVIEKEDVIYYKYSGKPKPFSLKVVSDSSGNPQRISAGCLTKTLRLSCERFSTLCCSANIICKKWGMVTTILNPTSPTNHTTSEPYRFESAYTIEQEIVKVEAIDITINTDAKLIDDECASGVSGSCGPIEITGVMTICADSCDLVERINKEASFVLELDFLEDKDRHERRITLRLTGMSLTQHTPETPNPDQRTFKFSCQGIRVAVHNEKHS